MEASHRAKQAQHFSTCRKVQNGNSRVHQDFPDSGGVGIVDRSIGRLPSHPHSSTLKEIVKILPQVSGVPIHFPPLRTGHNPQVFTMIVKEVKLVALSRGLRLNQYLDDWLIRSQSQEEAQVNTQAVVDLTQSLGWIINQEKSELKPTQVFSFVGYEYHLDSALVKPTQERWLKLQDLILQLKSKHVLTARCLMSLIGLPSHEALSVSPRGALEISSVAGQPPSLDRNDFCTPRLVAKSCQCDEGRRPSSQRPQYPALYRRLKRRLGRLLKNKVLLKVCGQNRKKGYT